MAHFVTFSILTQNSEKLNQIGFNFPPALTYRSSLLIVQCIIIVRHVARIAVWLYPFPIQCECLYTYFQFDNDWARPCAPN